FFTVRKLRNGTETRGPWASYCALYPRVCPSVSKALTRGNSLRIRYRRTIHIPGKRGNRKSEVLVRVGNDSRRNYSTPALWRSAARAQYTKISENSYCPKKETLVVSYFMPSSRMP